MQRILIVDDDTRILQLVRIQLEKEGFLVAEAKDGANALSLLNKTSCDLAVVDVMMPFMDGFQLTKEIRKQYDIPIILLTAKGQIEDKEEGFLAGTDDYLVKPFEPRELSFRIHALLRRYHQENDTHIIRLGDTEINLDSYEVKIGDKTLLLPLKEFELLALLATYPQNVFTRSQLIEKVWGIDYEGDDRTVDVHVKRLRERFSSLTSAFSIKTVRGVGYYLESAE
ncbi:DNA-binding response regulator [Oceanobacillus oncorhynchi subsp. incaldanensis]|uniref:Heme response regulator HssR n=1 Tax=Oceanobacillus oncorhynchi TaxID=545501 RepID=A0A0A1M5J2_9BACI|nr:response regulator transcription factor [Oceanobacillus oncorhynchi]GIO20286.1 DNA-binding response regulator [Oceanobacillus oncorhynchi subsp. incaldanensis]CEI80570.1 Heme response regulator HssR [Oceanobacillus oncorhynchi]